MLNIGLFLDEKNPEAKSFDVGLTAFATEARSESSDLGNTCKRNYLALSKRTTISKLNHCLAHQSIS